MAACVTSWRGVTEFSGSALGADRYNSKAGGSSVMRQSARISNGCVNVSKLTVAPMRKLEKVDGQKRGLCVTSAGSNEKFESAEQSENTEVPDTLNFDQTPGAEGSVSKSSLTANDPTDDEITSDFLTKKTQKLIDKTLGTEDEAITKDVSATSSSGSSSFGPPDSRAVIEVINKLLILLFNNMDLAIVEFKQCPQRDLILAIIVILLWLIWRCLLCISCQNGNGFIP